MCKRGDIILVKEYISGDGVILHKHPFIIIDDEGGKLTSIEAQYDFIGNVMSSFKNEDQRRHKLAYPGNLEITVDDGAKKDGVVKVEQFYYFSKDRIEYEVLGTVSEQLLEAIFELIQVLYEREEIRIVTANV